PGMGNLQAHNQLRVFARMSGGRYYMPVTIQDYDDVFRDIGQSVRYRYVMTYHPTHRAEDGVWHKIKVEVVPLAEDSPEDKALNGPRCKYQFVPGEGYRAKREVK